jgi:acyl-CoA reductase-like NAD-dependent aldehyde dehydrogenase
LPEVYERELALLVKELDIHISNVGVPQQKRHVESSQVGEAEIFDRPVGVSLIISGAENPFRFMLAPLAASIAAGNVTILAANAATGPNQQFLSLLSRVWNKYLDRDNNLLVTTFEISDVIADQVDLVTIYGTSWGKPERHIKYLCTSLTSTS